MKLFYYCKCLSLLICFFIEGKEFVQAKFKGRLGNHFFQIATAYSLALDNKAEAYFPDLVPNSDEHKHFFYQCNQIKPKKSFLKSWKELYPMTYSPITYRPNMILQGYFQNESYFSHHRKELIELFRPLPQDIEYIKNKYSFILNEPNSVCVHVRDYKGEGAREDRFHQLGKEYFQKAMNHFPEDTFFVVVSDNIELAKEIIGPNERQVYFVENEPFYIDFLILRLCQHQIISNSTFSWWAAWLNENPNKIVIRPKIWLLDRPDLKSPKDWIVVD